MRIREVLPCLLLAGAVAAAALPSVTYAQANVDPEKLKLAAEEFDAGRRAYKSGNYERAAAHFENAFRDAPSAQALRMAIRARQEAGDLARAATLCVRAQAQYPDDTETIQLAQSILRSASPKLNKVTVNCDEACTVSLDGRIVQDDAATRRVLYTTPGEHTLVAGWGKNRSVSKDLEGSPGGVSTLEFKAPPEPEEARPVPTAPPVSSAPPASSGGAVEVKTDGSGKAPPLLFWMGAGVTTVFGGLTVWSGLDTLNNPGPDAVKEACVGQGTGCPEYQDGLKKQSRTNYLLFSTGVGVASVAVIGLFFTDWGGDTPSGDKGKVGFVPSLDPGGGVGMTATGQF